MTELAPPTVPRRRRPILMLAVIVVLALAALWLGVSRGWIQAPGGLKFLAAADAPPAPAASPAALPSDQQLEQRLSAVTQRLDEIEQEATAASGQAARAESLMVAFAARRAIERGQPLGYLEDQLRRRFGAAQPQAVETVIRASTRPVTLQALGQELGAIEGDLTTGNPNEGAWQRITQELGSLFVIRHDSAPSPTPQRRMERARLFLEGGNVAGAISEVIRTPGRGAAGEWLKNARGYVQVQQALDAIETSALLTPGVANPPPQPQLEPQAQSPDQARPTVSGTAL